MDLFLQILPTLETKLQYLSSDFVSLSFNFSRILSFIYVFFASVIFLTYTFLVGSNIRRLLFNNLSNNYKFLISIALGYIFVGTCIAAFGFFSILNSTTLIIFVLVSTFIALVPISTLKTNIKELHEEIYNIYYDIKSNKLVLLGILLFTMVSIVSLINPQVREDQYHVDLPRIYLRSETTMIEPKENIHVSGSSLLSEMYYTLPIQLISKEAARIIHFLFYLLVIVVLTKFSNKFSFAVYVPLLFVTAPEIIHETAASYVDFQWIFLFLLSTLILISYKQNSKLLFLIGLLLGGMLATKLWTIVLIPAFILFTIVHNQNFNIKAVLKTIFLISSGIIGVAGIWFLRAYILTGNPLFPAFHTFTNLDNNLNKTYPFQSYFAFNELLLNPIHNLNVFSPIFFLGLLFLIYKLRVNIAIIQKYSIFKLVLIVFTLYLVINYPYGRYMLGAYILLIFLSSLGIYTILNNNKNFKYLFYMGTFIIFLYYFVSSLLVLPYSVGIANQNNYLSRILIRDDSSYYNFGDKFDKHITQDDKVGMYNFLGYYYADFNYTDINFILTEGNKSIAQLKNSGITKLMIRKGDIGMLCSRLGLTDCSLNKYELITYYEEHPGVYLYRLK